MNYSPFQFLVSGVYSSRHARSNPPDTSSWRAFCRTRSFHHAICRFNKRASSRAFPGGPCVERSMQGAYEPTDSAVAFESISLNWNVGSSPTVLPLVLQRCPCTRTNAKPGGRPRIMRSSLHKQKHKNEMPKWPSSHPPIYDGDCCSTRPLRHDPACRVADGLFRRCDRNQNRSWRVGRGSPMATRA